VKLRQLWKLLSGVALLVTGLLLGAQAPAAGSTGGCAGDVVVALDVAVWSRPGHDTHGFTLSEPLAPGKWRVRTSSSDEYTGRAESSQSQEQWLLDITDHEVLGPTSDLLDGVDAASTTDNLGTFRSSEGVNHFTVRHAATSTSDGTNSVTADCVSFTRVLPPTTTTTAAPTTSQPPATTVPSTTVPATTVPSTTVPSTTVPSTTVPSTTVPSTTVPSTTVPPPLPALIRVSAVVDCAADQVFVLLGNDGEIEATVDVALPFAAVDSGLAVTGGSITTSTLAIGELEGATEIRVSDSATGETYLRSAIDIDCADPARPTASTLLDCAADVLVVVLGNEAGDPAVLTVLHERVASIAEVEVAAGDTIQVEVALDGAATVPVRVVDAEGADVLRVEVENICPPPVDDPSVDDEPPADETDDGSASLDAGDCASSIHAAPECAEVQLIVEPDCPASLANVSIRRDGIGRERFVVLVDGTVAAVVAIDGVGDATVPVALGASAAELTVSRSTAPAPIVVGTLRCGGDGGRAGPIAAALVVFAVLSSAAGVLPWPSRGVPLSI